jgi:flagellar L-ring protein precursor FlgH
MKRLAPALLVLSCGVMSANAQSLFVSSVSENDQSQPTTLLSEVSMHFISEPENRIIQKQDIITIIIDENSSTTSSQKLETEKESRSTASIDAMVDWLKLLELRVRQGDISDVELIDLATSREFAGEGDYERKDRFTARISAIVREVKPNGTMLVEARKTIARDNEISELVLSGLIREEDVTLQNTILSSQMADLRIILENQGDLKEAAEKGLITRVLDSVFAF